jgi:probable phosphoglycerate mutase
VATAKLISGDRNISIKIHNNLKEINMGEWEGKTQTYIEENYPQEFFSFWNSPHLYSPLSGESFEELYSRVMNTLDQIKRENSSGNVLIVTHSAVIKCFLAYFKNNPLEKLWEPPYIHDTSVTIVEITGEKNRIILEGDLSHKAQCCKW